MNPKSTLLGFYSEAGKVIPVYSETGTFFEKVLQCDYRAHVVPIEIKFNSSKWTVDNLLNNSTNRLKELFRKGASFQTGKSSSLDYFVLMYAPAHRKEASRVGYLLQKKSNSDAYDPVTVDVNGTPYFVEIKGCGCPEGGMKGYSSWRQPHCADLYHTRLTGGLDYEEALREYDALQVSNDLYDSHGYNFFIKALAVGKLSEDLGILIRLTPSTFRASFRAKELDFIENSCHQIYKNMGKHSVLFLNHKDHLVHRNLNLNNMVYVDKNHYAITDLAECVSFKDGCKAMNWEIITFSTDLLLLPKTFQFDYIKGVQETLKNNDLQSDFKEINEDSITYRTLLHLNRKLITYFAGLDTFISRYNKGHSLKYFMENLEVISYFYPRSFFNSHPLEWSKSELLPELERKEKCLQTAIASKDPQKYLRQQFQRSSEKLPPHLGSSYNFYALDNFYTRFLTPTQKLPVLETSLKTIQKQLQELHKIIGNQTIPCISRQSFLDKSYNFNSVVVQWILPMLLPIHTYITHERAILDGAANSNLSRSKEIALSKSMNKLEDIETRITSDPAYYSAFLDSPNSFISELLLPYMCKNKSSI